MLLQLQENYENELKKTKRLGGRSIYGVVPSAHKIFEYILTEPLSRQDLKTITHWNRSILEEYRKRDHESAMVLALAPCSFAERLVTIIKDEANVKLKDGVKKTEALEQFSTFLKEGYPSKNGSWGHFLCTKHQHRLYWTRFSNEEEVFSWFLKQAAEISEPILNNVYYSLLEERGNDLKETAISKTEIDEWLDVRFEKEKFSFNALSINMPLRFFEKAVEHIEKHPNSLTQTDKSLFWINEEIDFGVKIQAAKYEQNLLILLNNTVLARRLLEKPMTAQKFYEKWPPSKKDEYIRTAEHAALKLHVSNDETLNRQIKNLKNRKVL